MVEKDAVRRGYDALASTYAAERAAEGRETAILEEFLDRLSGSHANSDADTLSVLDAGCGQGAPVLRRLAETASAVGVDLSREQLALARENAPEARLAQSDIATLPFEEGTFDAVTAFHSLIHVPLSDHQAVVAEFARVLRPGGRILLSEGTSEWTGSNPDWLDTGVEMQWNIAGAEATREQLRNTGFEVVSEWTASDELAGEDSEWVFFDAKLDE